MPPLLWDDLNLLTSHWNVQYDYTNGQLTELVDIIIASKAKLFICAIGVPPREVVEGLHGAGIVVMKCVHVVAYLTSKSLTVFLSQHGRAPKGTRIVNSPRKTVIHHELSMLPKHSILVRALRLHPLPKELTTVLSGVDMICPQGICKVTEDFETLLTLHNRGRRWRAHGRYPVLNLDSSLR